MAYNRGSGRSGHSGRSGSRGFRRDFGGPREMHKIKCSKCGKESEVPFKPQEGREVFCRDCYFKMKGITPREPREESEKTEESEEEAEEEESEEAEESEEE